MVIGEPDIVRNEGTDAATEVTVPANAGVHERTVPFEDSTVPAAPTVIRPVPPEVVGRAVPDTNVGYVSELTCDCKSASRGNRRACDCEECWDRCCD